jgi:hypothetical protein
MSKHRKDPLLEALKEGQTYTWTVPEGGNLASMRKAIKHGQTLTMAPITDSKEIQVGDFVLVKWHQSDIFHIVGEIQGDQFRIDNSLGKVNGWVSGKEILGRIVKIIESESRPDASTLLEQLEQNYHLLIQREQAGDEVARRLLSVVDDLRWYAGRLGPDRVDLMPRSNIWSFHQNLWRLSRQTNDAVEDISCKLSHVIDLAKQCVGQAGQIISLFETNETEVTQ